MCRLLSVSVLLACVAGCQREEKLNSERIALLIQAQTDLRDVKLVTGREMREPRFTEYFGAAVDSEGHHYDLQLDVAADSVWWKATRRTGSLTRAEAEEAIKRKLDWTLVSLSDGDDWFDGAGVNKEGNRYRIRAREGYDVLTPRSGIVIEVFDEAGSVARWKFAAYPVKGGVLGL